MAVYNVLVHGREGGDAFEVESGGKLVIHTGGRIVPGSETTAAHIAAIGLTTVAWTTGDKAKINSLITAVQNVGILATS